MTPQQLKNSILQRAIEGRLVEQRPTEGTAKELLKKIQAEKARLVEKGKIKKPKALPPITEEEKPFDIPEGWEWVRLDMVSMQIGDIDHKMPPTVLDGIPYISPLNFTGNGIDFDSAKKISHEDYIRLSKKICPERGDIIFPRYGTIGVIRQVNTDREFLASYSCCVIKMLSTHMDKKYIRYVLESPITKLEINRYINKTTQPNVGLKSIQQFLFPLPPLKEQRRIVAKIEELLPLIDKYDKAYTKLTDFNTRFPEAMKKSLLQYAIEGKLVEQRADEGTAQDLIKDIQAEKKRLIAEKKIKKPKALPPITEEEIPFDIPESWKWVRLLDIAEGGLGKTLNKSKDKGIEKPYLCSINVYWDGINLEKVKTALFDVESQKKYLLKKGDLLICEGGDAGRSAVWDNEDEMYYQNALHRIRFYGGINPYYFLYCLELFKAQGVIEAHCKGVTIKHLVQSSLNEIIFPLPPLSEQHRIVTKLEELLPFCDQLRNKQN